MEPQYIFQTALDIASLLQGPLWEQYKHVVSSNIHVG
jgi:hypothetical protein